ncbi:putative bZIP transcription factor [Aspergillus clavatus NRRL 1]|uniref:BZIP transcription factor, putative n=1 Tax=Aspergillus clavatus (strain ATCC 1007 / CBS 513.65 / DSM 816 / NCTC 3887 / NRRL 1 / QM 1276 / 107) TaxID=344612 RepID=A1CAY7_ASPCL|nr:bZIP transcription factor, putative [Aspergillus clavatus NRRL 1]EAW12905.1 bZIP transcription factor, putative [Aspergillus clavatus NRRL 1]
MDVFTSQDLHPRSRIPWDQPLDESPPSLGHLSHELRYNPMAMTTSTASPELYALSPHTMAYLGSNHTSPDMSVGYETASTGSGNNRRQSQNREAQRRFRERREQERVQLRRGMEELRTENDRLARELKEAQNGSASLEGENTRLKGELEALRKRWQDVLKLMSGMVQGEANANANASEGTPTSPTGSASSTAHHQQKDVQSLRSSMMMQMLVLLFEEKGPSKCEDT